MFDLLCKNLKRLGYRVSVFEDSAAAAEYLNKAIDGTTVGIGGTMTIEEMGLYPQLKEHNEVYWHWKRPEGVAMGEIIARANACEVYISSVNGIAETGEIVNIDGTGNRVASIFYGHKRVYLVIGKNKLTKTFDEALWRARNVAAPLNAKRLGKKTPCAKAGRCFDCNSAERICRGLSVLWTKPEGCEYEIILVGEDLGY